MDKSEKLIASLRTEKEQVQLEVAKGENLLQNEREYRSKEKRTTEDEKSVLNSQLTRVKQESAQVNCR